jgi:hypothetical protein
VSMRWSTAMVRASSVVTVVGELNVMKLSAPISFISTQKFDSLWCQLSRLYPMEKFLKRKCKNCKFKFAKKKSCPRQKRTL